MINITLKDGSIIEIESGKSIFDIIRTVSPDVARSGLCAKLNDKTVEMSTLVNQDSTIEIFTFEEDIGKNIYWHTASHILAHAVKRLYPNSKLAIGPAISNGFYYDFDTEVSFTLDDLAKIEAEMKKIIKEDLKIERFELNRTDAVALMTEKNEPYKVELILDLPEDAVLSFYKQGEFTDLCAGPHLFSTGRIKAYKLISLAGAYWKGSEKNKMLQRIYGVAYPKNEDLGVHLEMLEEAKKRDHNKLGRELELFTTSECIGQGLPLLMPKGARIIQTLQRFVEDEEERRGYVLTKTPLMAKSDLYKLSGHWAHYKDGMFVLGDESKDEEVLALRPMTCPFQFTIYNTKLHSYRDLPIRYGETSTLFRNESSGEMHGLIRVRQFTISEGHIVCTPDQLENEFIQAVDLIYFMMKTLGIDQDITFRFSKYDPNNKEKYIDNPAAWEDTQTKMKNMLDKMGIVYKEAEDEAAFYGPKLDVQMKNVHGKEDTIITVQIDFALADKLDMSYVDKDNEKKRPYIIHRTSIGCYERTLALLIEKYAGAFPTWLAPVQAIILPISERHFDYALEIKQKLINEGIKIECDLRNEKVGYKIREAQLAKIPYMLVCGDNEMQDGKVSVRSRKEGDLGAIPIDEFIANITNEIKKRTIN